MRNALVRIAIVAVCSAPLVWAPADVPAQTAGGQFGTVRFPTSCQPAVQPQFERAVAILHSFFYEESDRRFRSIAERDPHCAMAWWGVAMGLWHPPWDPPDSAPPQLPWATRPR